MAFEDIFDDVSNDDIDTAAAGIEAGTVSDARVETLADILVNATEEEIATVIDGKPALEDLILAVEDELGTTIVPGLGAEIEIRTQEEIEALEDIRRIAMQTTFTVADLIQTRDAIQNDRLQDAPPVVRTQLERLSESALDEVLDLVRQQITARRDLTVDDFPAIDRATERASGRTVEGYFQPLLEDLESGDPGAQDILREQGVPQSEIETLFQSPQVLEQFIEKVENNIQQIRGQRGGPTPAAEAPDEEGPLGVPTEMFIEAGITQGARRIVPGRQRHDYIANTDWSASMDQVRLELTFMTWVLEQFGNSKRWSKADFELMPQNRDMSMRRWARLQVQAGNVTPTSAFRAGLPGEWFEGL